MAVVLGIWPTGRCSAARSPVLSVLIATLNIADEGLLSSPITLGGLGLDLERLAIGMLITLPLAFSPAGKYPAPLNSSINSPLSLSQINISGAICRNVICKSFLSEVIAAIRL